MFTLCAKSWYARACCPAARAGRRARAGTRPSWPATSAGRSATSHVVRRCAASSDAPELEQRLARGQVGLDGVGRRNVRRRHQLVGASDGVVEGAAPDGELDLQHLDRPFVPLAGLRAVAAVGLAGLAEIFAGAIVGAAHQVNLGQRVEHGAGRHVELHRLADFERAHQDVFRRARGPRSARTPAPGSRA